MDKQFLAERKKAVKEIARLTALQKQCIESIEELADQYGIRVELDLPATGYNGDVWYVPNLPEELREKIDAGEDVDLSGTEWEESAEFDSYGEQHGWKNSSSYC